MSKQKLVSCYQCAGFRSCFGSIHVTLPREAARARASACSRLEKGRTTEVVKVIGQLRGVSRKNAQRMVEMGKACWVAKGVLAQRLQGGQLTG